MWFINTEFNRIRDQLFRRIIVIYQHFFKNSSYEAKLAFFRDAQSKGLIYDNLELKLYLKEQLLLLHLNDEAARIPYPE
jgi:hypothetical protein